MGAPQGPKGILAIPAAAGRGTHSRALVGVEIRAGSSTEEGWLGLSRQNWSDRNLWGVRRPPSQDEIVQVRCMQCGGEPVPGATVCLDCARGLPALENLEIAEPEAHSFVSRLMESPLLGELLAQPDARAAAEWLAASHASGDIDGQAYRELAAWASGHFGMRPDLPPLAPKPPESPEHESSLGTRLVDHLFQ